MNDLEQEIAIAKVCGWTHTKTVCNPDPSAYGRHPIHTADVAWDLPLPDYLNDLNAMHEAEGILIFSTRQQYYRQLVDTVTDSTKILQPALFRVADIECCRATARQRAEAFLKTLYLWKP